MVRIARVADYTTGMLAHYFDSKQDIIIAALRLILRRIDERLSMPLQGARPELLTLLLEALPVTFINGLTASAVANPADWPPEQQIAQLRLQLQLQFAWANGGSQVRKFASA
jgi:AcrR family transcriptional regulator